MATRFPVSAETSTGWRLVPFAEDSDELSLDSDEFDEETDYWATVEADVVEISFSVALAASLDD